MKVVPVFLASLACAAATAAFSIIGQKADQLPLGLGTDSKSYHPAHSNYKALPSLKEQDDMERRWLDDRYKQVPQILEK
jgi:hypothetical protein